MPPMDWANANFCALMTRGEKHLRQEVGFASPTETRLNLADFDWTVEFWYRPDAECRRAMASFWKSAKDRAAKMIMSRNSCSMPTKKASR